MHIGHSNIQGKELKLTKELFLLAIVIIDMHLEKFSFNSISDVCPGIEELLRLSLTQNCYFKAFITQIVLT